MAICISCQNTIESPVCPHCGYPVHSQNEPHQLPVGTLLRNRYQVGKVLGQGHGEEGPEQHQERRIEYGFGVAFEEPGELKINGLVALSDRRSGGH